jgi:tRNA threonylcarbamoyladenosine biosynthesis protein TsaE
MKESFTVGEEDVARVAQDVIETLVSSHKGGARIVLLEGDLGAGKTTFTKALGKELGLHEEDIFSPTFILKKEHATPHDVFSKLVHIDAYRFENVDEGKVLKLEEDLEKDGALIVIEWPSKMGISEGDMRIHFAYNDEGTRDMYIEYDPSYDK